MLWQYTKRDSVKNFFPLPNDSFSLGLSSGALAVYSYLLYCEGRKTYQCHPSYRSIGKAVRMSANTVRKYVTELPVRRPHVSGQRPAHAPAGAKTSRAGADTFPRPPSHILGPCPAKRRGRENPLRYAGTLLGGFYLGHIRPRHHLHAEAGGERGGEFPLRRSLVISAPNSGMGHGLGQIGAVKSSHQKKCREINKAAEILWISAALE